MFAGDGGRRGRRRLAAVICCDVRQSSGERERPVDFHDLKGDLDSLAIAAGAELDYRPSQAAWGHPGRSADVFRIDADGEAARIGWIGQLHPRLQKALDLDTVAVAFEVDLAALQQRPLAAGGPQPLPVRPRISVRRPERSPGRPWRAP